MAYKGCKISRKTNTLEDDIVEQQGVVWTRTERTEKVGGLWQRVASYSGRTQPRIEYGVYIMLGRVNKENDYARTFKYRTVSIMFVPRDMPLGRAIVVPKRKDVVHDRMSFYYTKKCSCSTTPCRQFE